MSPRTIYAVPGLLEVLEKIWLASDMPCGKRLKSILPGGCHTTAKPSEGST